MNFQKDFEMLEDYRMHFSFHKLGWFRLDERGRPFVQSGDIFLDKIHHARVENCAEQRYRSVLEASHYITRKDSNVGIHFTH